MLNDPTAYQIEHIIPYAVSLIISMNNKSLASAKENQDKGNETPWTVIFHLVWFQNAKDQLMIGSPLKHLLIV